MKIGYFFSRITSESTNIIYLSIHELTHILCICILNINYITSDYYIDLSNTLEKYYFHFRIFPELIINN